MSVRPIFLSGFILLGALGGGINCFSVAPSEPRRVSRGGGGGGGRTVERVLLSASASATASLSPPATSSSSADAVPPRLFPTHFKKSSIPANAAALTYLEINGWLLTSSNVTVLIDPILEGPLDFGLPASVYSASKRTLPALGMCESLPPIDCILITQGLDDHAHVRTLTMLAEMDGDVPIVAPPSARGALERSGFSTRGEEAGANNVHFVRPGESCFIAPRDAAVNSIGGTAAGIDVRATRGALVGPPWQARENGYILRPRPDTAGSEAPPSIYIEPHVEFDPRELARESPVDVVITPVSGQGLPAFELVHGPSDAARLVRTLRAKYVLPMQNGDVDAEGLASRLVQSVGTPEEFRTKIRQGSTRTGERNVEVLNVVPGEDILLKR